MIDWDNITVDHYDDTWYAFHTPTGNLATGRTNVEALESLLKLLGE